MRRHKDACRSPGADWLICAAARFRKMLKMRVRVKFRVMRATHWLPRLSARRPTAPLARQPSFVRCGRFFIAIICFATGARFFKIACDGVLPVCYAAPAYAPAQKMRRLSPFFAAGAGALLPGGFARTPVDASLIYARRARRAGLRRRDAMLATIFSARGRSLPWFPLLFLLPLIRRLPSPSGGASAFSRLFRNTAHLSAAVNAPSKLYTRLAIFAPSYRRYMLDIAARYARANTCTSHYGHSICGASRVAISPAWPAASFCSHFYYGGRCRSKTRLTGR